jgi:hypothetical protein
MIPGTLFGTKRTVESFGTNIPVAIAIITTHNDMLAIFKHLCESYYDVVTYAEMVRVAFSPNVMAELDSDPRIPSSQPVL